MRESLRKWWKMKNKKFSPIYMFIILTLAVIVLSFVLSLFNLQAEYSTVNSYTNTLQNNVVQVENLLSLKGFKYIVSTTVSNFVNFAPLGNLIIVLIGIGVLERTGFAKTFFTLITQSFRKNSITFLLILLSILSGMFGEIGFVVFLPIGALLFKYGHRNPIGGIFASFAGVCFGHGMNVFLSNVEISLVKLTTLAAHAIDKNYVINNHFQIIIAIIAVIVGAILMTRVTEKTIMPKLGKYEFDEIETLDNVKFSNKELRGLIVGIGAAIVYTLIILYNIIPGLPLSGGLLDMSASSYIDKLLGPDSLFSQGFVFIVTILFVLVGFAYASFAKTIKGSKEISESLSFSLDKIGNVLVLMIFASLFINTFLKSNIGLVVVAFLSNLINAFNFSGLGLIVLLFVISIIAGLFYTGLLGKWEVMSATVVPHLMNASVSPEFAQVIFVAGSSISLAFTPLMSYFVIFISLISMYDKTDKYSLSDEIRLVKNYALVMIIMWFILLVGFYITGLPIGSHSSPVLKF